jgi:hypothetical protein
MLKMQIHSDLPVIAFVLKRIKHFLIKVHRIVRLRVRGPKPLVEGAKNPARGRI